MKLKDWLLPREERFFDLLAEQAAVVVTGSKALLAMIEEGTNFGEHRRRIKEIERLGDQKTHALFTALNGAFITPIDREDITSLGSALDDILDFAYATANHLHLYGVTQTPPALLDIAKVLVVQSEAVERAVRGLKTLSEPNNLPELLIEIHHLENQADDLTNDGVAALFQTDDVKHIIKMKDIFATIEVATDKCEDVAETIRTIIVKHS